MIMELSKYPGIGRAHYVIVTVGLMALVLLTFSVIYFMVPGGAIALMTEEWHFWAWLIGLAVFWSVGTTVALVLPAVLRLRNLGMSGWWCLAYLLPIIDLWLIWRLVACPVGYSDHRQLDLVGKILSAFFAIIFGLPVLCFVMEVILKPFFGG